VGARSRRSARGGLIETRTLHSPKMGRRRLPLTLERTST
jgi:hypothetical protein